MWNTHPPYTKTMKTPGKIDQVGRQLRDMKSVMTIVGMDTTPLARSKSPGGCPGGGDTHRVSQQPGSPSRPGFLGAA